MNTVHTEMFVADGQGGFGSSWRAIPEENVPTLSPEINRMLSAAVVSATFRRLLLSDPAAALSRGYNGESFEVQAEELAQIVLIKASSLAEFASQLIDRLWYGRGDAEHGPVQRANDATGPSPLLMREPVAVYAGHVPDARHARAGNDEVSIDPTGRRRRM